VPTLDEYGDELYQLPPARFVAARNAHAAALKKAGDKDTAAQVAALRRPTTLGWLINLVALRRPDLIASWFDLGEQLRMAQTGLVGGEVRRLTGERRALLADLLGQVATLAAEAGHSGPVPTNDVATTLTSALADPEVAAQVRAGRLLGAASYAGFGQQPEETWGEATAAPHRRPPAPRPDRAPAEEAGAGADEPVDEIEEADEAAEAEVDAARAALVEAQDLLASARGEEAEARQELAELAEELAGLEERVRAAERRRGEATTARQNAERAVAAARDAIHRLTR
jgi:hypothetical protein